MDETKVCEDAEETAYQDATEETPASAEELRAAILQETAMVAVKSSASPLRKSIKELSSLGVGTFSIDEDTAKNMVSGRFVKRIKIKRCGKCKGCRSRNCKQCIACKDMLKYGGQGMLKQACIHRRCANPTSKGKQLF